MTTLTHNVDDVRTEIMRLENETIFVQADWDRVQRTLIEQGRTMGLADCQRRMATARQNARYIGGVDWGRGESIHVITDLGFPGSEIELTLIPVAVETEPA